MLNALKRVRGAVATGNLIPVLKAFHVYEGRIQGTNGQIIIDTPCPELGGLDFTIDAKDFLRAVDACGKEPTIRLTEKQVIITAGKFRAALPLLEHDAYPRQELRTGSVIACPGPLLPALTVLRPFTGEKVKGLPWATGVGIAKGAAYATNNTVVATAPAPFFPEALNLAPELVDELLRIGEEPATISCGVNDITMAYEGGFWLRGVILAALWPDVANYLTGVATEKVPEGLKAAVDQLLPFADDGIILTGPQGISTLQGDRQANNNAFKLADGAYNGAMLSAVLAIADKLNFTAYPAPCPWEGKNGVRGIILGVRG